MNNVYGGGGRGSAVPGLRRRNYVRSRITCFNGEITRNEGGGQQEGHGCVGTGEGN